MEQPERMSSGEAMRWNEDVERRRRQYVIFVQVGEEEDEDRVKSVLYILHEVADNYNFDEWLKSLKDRVQPKQEWSEEDERTIKEIDEIIYECPYCESKEEISNWLKSLKDRYTWKPSDEQMATLHKYAEQNNYDGSILTSLYNDLKKLREK